MISFTLQGIMDSDEQESIARCLKNLYATPAGSVPCDRNFGLSWVNLDTIPESMEAVFGLELIEKTDQYEPRVKAVGFDFIHKADGTVEVMVELTQRGGIGLG